MSSVKTPRVIFKETKVNAMIQGEPMTTDDARDANEDPELAIGEWCQEHRPLKEKP